MAGSWPLRVPLRWRVVLLLAVLAVFNVGFTALTRSEIARARELDQVAAGLVTAVRVEERLQAARDNQVLAIRAYALTGQAGFLRDYRVHRRVAAARAQQLAGLLRDEPALLRLEEQAELGWSPTSGSRCSTRFALPPIASCMGWMPVSRRSRNRSRWLETG